MADALWAYDGAMPMTPMLFSIAMALAPLGACQQARVAAWLDWGAAYRDCYLPEPFSLRNDKGFTARCVERRLQHQEVDAPPAERAATAALIAATPQLITMLNASAKGSGGTDRAARGDPALPLGQR